MKLTIENIKLLFAGIIISTVFYSCNEKNNDLDMTYNRIFRPTSFTIKSASDSVEVRWSAVPGASRYIIQVSNDSLKFENIVFTDSIEVVYPDTVTGYRASVNELLPLTRYSLRLQVKALDKKVLPSKYCQSSFVTE